MAGSGILKGGSICRKRDIKRREKWWEVEFDTTEKTENLKKNMQESHRTFLFRFHPASK